MPIDYFKLCGALDEKGGIFRELLIKLDGSVYPNIRSIRSKVGDFLKTESPITNVAKIISIYDVDSLTLDAQKDLAFLIEEYGKNVFFLLTATATSGLSEELLSKVTTFRLRKLSDEDILARLKYILDQEKCKITDDELKDITELAEGKLAPAVNGLYFKCVNQLPPQQHAVKVEIVRPEGDYKREHKRTLFEYMSERQLEIPKEIKKEFPKDTVSISAPSGKKISVSLRPLKGGKTSIRLKSPNYRDILLQSDVVHFETSSKIEGTKYRGKLQVKKLVLKEGEWVLKLADEHSGYIRKGDRLTIISKDGTTHLINI